jgi:flavin reductase (DIM6/NTAB) family NADH-FMN oxidoreductase RutF
MHVFQPLEVDSLEFNPFTKIGKGGALVSAGTKAKANTMTVSWGGFGVLWGKNVVFIFIRDSRYTKEFIDNSEFFSVSFLGNEYKESIDLCGNYSGRDVDKMSKAGLTWNYKHSIPFIDEGNFILICHKLSATELSHESFIAPDIKDWYADGDMHTMYVAEIMDFLAR